MRILMLGIVAFLVVLMSSLVILPCMFSSQISREEEMSGLEQMIEKKD